MVKPGGRGAGSAGVGAGGPDARRSARAQARPGGAAWARRAAQGMNEKSPQNPCVKGLAGFFVKSEKWSRRELNPRPVTVGRPPLHV